MRTVAGKVRGNRGQVISLVFFAAATHGDFPVRVLWTPTSDTLTSLEAFFPPSSKNLSLNRVLLPQSLLLFLLKRSLHPAYIAYSLRTIVY
jgi:hypothetical protein